MKKVCLILSLFILAGCGGGLKSSWDDFTAYYNTFYNAKNDFKAGLQKVNDQPVQINPQRPIRPHPAPINAGENDFEEAIDKSAQILRRHSESKWADDALLLIGKSYYYRQEFFLAIQTFEDLLNYGSSPNLHQQATLWKARALLDISSYTEGVQFLESQLSAYEGEWDSERRAEVNILLAQHHAMLENWQQAVDLLEPATLKLGDRPLKARSYFLLGQVLQQQGDYNRAFQAYSNVASNFPDYEYVYWAGIKRAEVARLNKNEDLALSIYESMLNDDKNFDRSDELYFQLGQTYEQQGNVDRAETIYRQILGDDSNSNTTDISADVYYRLGQLYSNNYNNYELAAAYFDSSLLQASTPLKNDEADNVTTLASAYGDYVSLKSQISNIDSLLALGNLSEGALDSVLADVRRQRRDARRQNATGVAQTANTITNVNSIESVRETVSAGNSASYGFLNHRNARLADNSRQQFRAVWGARPLIDNWRRTNAILSTGSEQNQVAEQGSANIKDTGSDESLDINTEDIPVTEQAKLQKRRERLALEYRLGNLFFLTLNQPDSAKIYFKKVLHDTLSSEVKPRSLYSLLKLYELQQQADSAAHYRRRILDEYPESVFAERIQTPEGTAYEISDDSTKALREKVQNILSDESTPEPSRQRAEKLRSLALENRDAALAPAIFYQGIREYIRFAKKMPADSSLTPPREQVEGTDTLRSDSPERSWSPYSGPSWDRVRGWLEEFKTVFPDASQMQRISTWQEALDNPTESAVLRCSDLGIQPSVQPDMQSFINAIELPKRLKALNLSGSLEYRLVINTDGTVNSYELTSRRTNLGIEDAYEQVIENKLRFEPITQNGRPVRASCEVEFPIKQ